MKKILVLGAGGFIGNALVNRLVSQGHFVRGVDIKTPEFTNSPAQEFVLGDLRDRVFVCKFLQLNDGQLFDEIYHMAADMGGADFVFTGKNDADILTNSMQITINVLSEQKNLNTNLNINKTKIFYASSACIYPEHNQLESDNPDCRESTAYPANPDSNYGWEKIFGERIFLAYAKNYNIPVRIARYHNVYGAGSTYQGGREKAPAALCRKVLTSDGNIEIYGDGNQTRSFLYIDDAIDATLALMESNYSDPINIGSEEMISINDFVDIIAGIERKQLNKIHQPGPLGVRGRNSNNDVIRSVLHWEPKISLREGITRTYLFIQQELQKRANSV